MLVWKEILLYFLHFFFFLDYDGEKLNKSNFHHSFFKRLIKINTHSSIKVLWFTVATSHKFQRNKNPTAIWQRKSPFQSSFSLKKLIRRKVLLIDCLMIDMDANLIHLYTEIINYLPCLLHNGSLLTSCGHHHHQIVYWLKYTQLYFRK